MYKNFIKSQNISVFIVLFFMSFSAYSATLNLTTKYGRTGGLRGDLNAIGNQVNGNVICTQDNTNANIEAGCDMFDDPGYVAGPNTPADDSYNGDLVVRTNDNFELVAGWSWLGVAGGPEEQVTISSTLPAGTNFIFDGIPGACDQALSTLSVDGKTIDCVRVDFDTNDVGSYAEDLAFAVRVEGDAINGDTPGALSLSINDPTTSGPVTDDTEGTSLVITAAPRWNIDKNNYTIQAGRVDDAGNPGWWIWYNFLIEVDEVSGATDSPINPSLGNEALAGGANATVTFTDDLSMISPNAKLVTWDTAGSFTPVTNACDMDSNFSNGDEPYTVFNATFPDRSIQVAPGVMNVTCTQAGTDVSVTVTGIDSTLTKAPIRNRNGGLLPVNRNIAAVGVIRVFVPLQDAIDAGGSLATTNCLTDFEPNGVSGGSNFGADTESELDNCQNNTLNVSAGGWDKNYRKGWSDRGGERAKWGGGSWALPPTDSALVEAGDGTVTPSGVWGTYTVHTNTGGSPFTNVTLCDVIDVETYEMTIIDPSDDYGTAGTGVFDLTQHAVNLTYSSTETNAGLSIEYATGYVGSWPPDPTVAPSTGPTDEVVDECSDPAITWYPDLVTAEATDGAPVSKVRITVPSLDPGLLMAMRIKHTARANFLSSGLPIPNDTLLINHSSYTRDGLSGTVGGDGRNWRAGDYIPLDASQPPPNGGGGDRLTMVRAKARILKDMGPGAVSPGSETTVTLTPSFTTDGPNPEMGTVVIADLLPVGMDYTFGSTTGTFGSGATPYGEPLVIHPTSDADCNTHAADVVAEGFPCGDTLNGGATGTTILVWDLGVQTTGLTMDDLIFNGIIAVDAPAPVTLQNYVQISSTADSSPSSQRVANANVSNTVPSSLLIVKSVLTPLHEINSTPAANNWMNFQIGLRNGSSTASATNLDFIDILPFNGDGVSGSFTFTPAPGTTVDRLRDPASNFSGTLEFDNTSFDDNGGACDTTTLEYWYTRNAGPLDISPKNTALNDTATGSSNWCQGTAAGPAGCDGGDGPINNADVTAFRVIGPDFPPSATCFVNVTYATAGINLDENIYSNTAGAEAQGVTNAVLSNTVSAAVYASSIGDYVWHDINDNGVQDAFEPAIPGVTVRLLDGAGAPVIDRVTGLPYEVVTDANGNYLFENLIAADYQLEFLLPAGMEPADKDLGGDDTLDSDVNPSGITDTVTLGENEDNTDVDAGIKGILTLGDFVWDDTNGDGIQDAGEAGVPDTTVNLLNADGTPVLGPDGNPLSVQTDGNGAYTFTDLIPGDYIVEFVPPAGYSITQQDQLGDDAADSDADPATGQTAVINLTENLDTVDAGLYLPASVGDTVWSDTNADGIQDAGETGVQGATVILFDAAGNEVPVGPDGILGTADDAPGGMLTDAAGNYEFSGLAPGDYSIEVTPPAGYDISPQDSGGDDTTDSDIDPATGRTPTINLESGENDPNWDAGLYQPASVGDTVWRDANADGVQDAGESGIPNVTVKLYDDAGNEIPVGPDGILGTADDALGGVVTDPGGNYQFSGLVPGDYVVEVTPPAGFVVSPQDAGGDDAVDSDIAPVTGQTSIINLESGENDPNWDAGLYTLLTLGDQVFEDTDGNGLFDAGDAPIVGAQVELLDAAGAVIATTTTDAAGNYAFGDLEPGDYSVRVTPPAGFIPTVNQVADPENDVDNDSNIDVALITPSGSYQSGSITLLSGAEPDDDGDTDTDTNMSVDFGFVRPASVGNKIWLDENSDGIQDAGEDGVANVTVELKDAAGNVIATTVTDSNGGYLFSDLPPGDYFVDVDETTLPPGMTQTPLTNPGSDFGNQDHSGDGYPVVLASGDENLTADFGYNYNPTTDVDGNTGNAALGDRIWIDSDGDGVQDEGEVAVEGAVVSLFTDPDGDGVYDTPYAAQPTATTDANGNYIFDDLPPDGYVVEVTDSSAASHDILNAGNYAQTGDPDHFASDTSTALPGTAGDNKTSNPVVLAPGDVFVNADFGYQPQTAAPVYDIGDTIWTDINRDGVKDPAETGIPGVTVALKDAAGNFIATTTTDENGQYLFEDLPDGTYMVVITDTDNVLDGMAPTYDQDNGTVNPDEESTVVIAGADNLDQDFGYVPSGPNNGTGAIGDTIFLDSDGSGDPTPGEGLEGVMVTLKDVNGNVVAVTTTDENGNYLFTGLPDGDYTVEVDPATLPAGVDNTIDPDGGNDGTSAVTIAGGNTDLDQDFGYTAINPGKIGNLLWNDVDADGIYEPDGTDGIPGTADDEKPIGGVTVDLYRDLNGNGLVDPGEPLMATTITTDSLTDTSGDQGNYLFDGLPGGDYIVDVSDKDNALAGYWHSEGAANTTDNSQADTYPVALPDGGEDLTADFGYYVKPGAVGNVVWQDLDGNGVYDPASEPVMANVTVQMEIEYPDGTITTLTTVTDAGGNYSFANLLLDEAYDGAGTYGNGGDEPSHTVTIDPATIPDGLGSIYAGNTDTTTPGGEPTDDDDQDVGGDDPAGEQAFPPMGGVDPTNDFGYQAPASIGNRVWLDFDADGAQDANEDGIAGVTVVLTPPVDIDLGNGPGAPIETITGSNGEYLFPDLPPADGYVVTIPTPPPGLTHTFDEDGDNNNDSGPISLSPGEEHLTADFGYSPPPGSIGDTLWIDTDGDGIQDPGELGIPGVTVNLLDVDGNVIATTTTNAQGKYLFSNLPEGIYGVEVDTTTLPVGYTAHPNGDPDVRDGVTTVADNVTTVQLETLLDGTVESNLDADFGYLPPADQNNSIGDTVWIDTNGDGIQDPDESGVAGVTLTLLNEAGEPVASTTTDEDGQYLFTGVPDGTYTVVVTDAANVLDGSAQTYDADGLGTPNQSTVTDLGVGVDTPVDDLDQEFGYTPVDNALAENTGVIGDTIYFDVDGDGTQGVSESGLEGVTVELRDEHGNLIGVAVTDENGHYMFTGLEVSDTGANYTVTVKTDTLPGGGDNWLNSGDPDGASDSTSTVTLTIGSPVNLDQDFGFGGGINSLQGTIWPDTNGDGVQDEGETIAGVTVDLLDPATGNIIDSTTTDANGNYEFTNLPDGPYTVMVTDDDNILAGFEHTDGAPGVDKNSQADDGTYVVDLDSAGVIDTPVIDVTSDSGYKPTLTTPITLGTFESEALSAGDVKFSWTTQSEIANAGFMIYQKVGDEWLAVNEDIIPAVGESLETVSYSYTGHQVEGVEFVLVDVDTRGKQTLHGPFALGERFGAVDKPVLKSRSSALRAHSNDRAAARKRTAKQGFKVRLDSYLGR